MAKNEKNQTKSFQPFRVLLKTNGKTNSKGKLYIIGIHKFENMKWWWFSEEIYNYIRK